MFQLFGNIIHCANWKLIKICDETYKSICERFCNVFFFFPNQWDVFLFTCIITQLYDVCTCNFLIVYWENERVDTAGLFRIYNSIINLYFRQLSPGNCALVREFARIRVSMVHKRESSFFFSSLWHDAESLLVLASCQRQEIPNCPATNRPDLLASPAKKTFSVADEFAERGCPRRRCAIDTRSPTKSARARRSSSKYIRI